jgi:nitroimidazol reductase NimA-like FMN-containing flavoprotein (pyridoxamine 5'-phosphate oxidase superfamily)
MRKKEFEIKEQHRLEEVLRETDTGYLAFNGPDGYPRVTPLNFAYDGRILWHGSMEGERSDCLKKDPRATFSAVSVQIFLPSYLTSEKSATGASVVFKSVQIRGRCEIIADPEEKCAVLNRLMDKYQPEGRYSKVASGDPLYAEVLVITGIYALHVEIMTGKFRFAQNKTEEERRKFASWLDARGRPGDKIAVREILDTLTK